MKTMVTAATRFRNGSTPSSSFPAMVRHSLSTRTGTQARPELRPEEVAQPDRRRADDPERRALGRHHREHEPDGDRRHDEAGHPEVEERVDVLQHAAHRRDALEVQHAEVVEIDEHEREQQQQLRPLADVAQEHLQILHQQLPPDRRHGEPVERPVDPAPPRDADLARLLRLAESREVPALKQARGTPPRPPAPSSRARAREADPSRPAGWRTASLPPRTKAGAA